MSSKPLIDGNLGVALCVGALVVGIYLYYSRGQQQQQQQPNNSASPNRAPSNQQQALGYPAAAARGSGPAAIMAQQQAAAAALRVALPSRTDDLAQLVAAHRHTQWPIMLHTKTRFESVPLPMLKHITSSFPNLLIIHQLASAADETEDVRQIRAHVDPKFPRHRLLLCTTEKGPEAMARQHEPALLVSENRTLVNFMSQFVAFSVHVDPFSTGDGIRSEVAGSVSPGLTAVNRPAAAAAQVNRVHIVSNVGVILN